MHRDTHEGVMTKMLCVEVVRSDGCNTLCKGGEEQWQQYHVQRLKGAPENTNKNDGKKDDTRSTRTWGCH